MLIHHPTASSEMENANVRIFLNTHQYWTLKSYPLATLFKLVDSTSIGKDMFLAHFVRNLTLFHPHRSRQCNKTLHLFFRRPWMLRLFAANWGTTRFLFRSFLILSSHVCPLSVGGCESQMILLFFLLCFPRPTQFKRALSVNNIVKYYLVCCASV